jgi:Zn-dependent protease with chaperone function
MNRKALSWGCAIAALAVISALSWWGATHGLPLAAADALAQRIPAQADAALGAQALAAIDKDFCKPSEIHARGQEALQRDFAKAIAGLNDGHAYRLYLRDCPAAGPNAIALPGGAIVLTDQLARLAKRHSELTAVLAHEVGHVRSRHGLRTTLRSAGPATLISTLVGDAAAVTSLATALPSVIVQSGYPREFEDEADSFALERTKALGISPRAFADILARIGQSRPAKAQETAARIERALAGETDAERCAYPTAATEQIIESCSRAIASKKLGGRELARANNTLAWVLATAPQDGLRDGGRATRIAYAACEQTDWRDAAHIDTLAAAHAETGNFAEAVRWQTKALELPDFQGADRRAAIERLTLYQSGRPYREQPNR